MFSQAVIQVPARQGKRKQRGKSERKQLLRKDSLPNPRTASLPAAASHSFPAAARRALTCSGTRPGSARGRRGRHQEPGGCGPRDSRRRGRLATQPGAGQAAQAGGFPLQQGGAEPPRALKHAGQRRHNRRGPSRAEERRSGAGWGPGSLVTRSAPSGCSTGSSQECWAAEPGDGGGGGDRADHERAAAGREPARTGRQPASAALLQSGRDQVRLQAGGRPPGPDPRRERAAPPTRAPLPFRKDRRLKLLGNVEAVRRSSATSVR